jgi:PAS domain-containing protein
LLTILPYVGIMEPSALDGLSGSGPGARDNGDKPDAPLKKPASFSSRAFWGLAALMGGAVFALDILTPTGTIGGFPYLALVLLGLTPGHRRHVPVLAGIATFLALAGGAIPLAEALSPASVINRALALAMIGGAAFLLHRRNLRTKDDEAEDAAPQRVAALEAALGSMAQGFSAFDKDDRLIAFNDKVSEYFDYPQGFLRIGMTNADIFKYRIAQGHYGKGNPDEILARLLERSKNRSERVFEQRLQNGRSHIFHRRPMPDGGYVNTYTDITRLKQAEMDAAAKSDLLEGIFKTGGTGFYIVDPDLNLVKFNETYRDLMGFPDGFLRAGMSLEDIARQRHAQRHFEERDLEEVLARRRNFDGAESLGEHELPDGRSYIYRRRPLPQGGFVTSYTETTALKEAVREAAEKSPYLEGIFQSGAAAFCIVDAEFNVVEFNEAYEELFGFPKGFLRPGLSRLEVTRFRHELGHFPGESQEEALKRRMNDRSFEKFDERTLPDGTSYIYRRKILPQGGYVTTYIETTALRQAREEAQEKSSPTTQNSPNSRDCRKTSNPSA